MTKTTFTATAPNGKTFTRTSENRTYTHTVVICRSREFALAEADGPRRESSIKHHNVYANYAAKGWNTPAWMNADTAAAHRQKGFDVGAEFLAEHGTDAEVYAESVYQAAAAIINAPYFTEYGSVGWCGRPDLADKLAASTRHPRFAEVLILEATAA